MAGASTDFNGDGFTDAAVADPKTSVGGVAAAGRVHVLFGDTAGTVTLTSPQIGVAGEFGSALEVYDYNLDNCDDLVVGAPLEPTGAVARAGSVYVYPGTPTGLATPVTYRQGTAPAGTVAETGDNFGASLAAGMTSGGLPFLVVGSPGESVETLAAAGSVLYLRAGTWTEITEDSAGVEGFAEAGDRFGSVLAASSLHFAVGAPLEDVSAFVDSGNVDVFSHTFTSGVPQFVGFLNQEMEGQSGYAEDGDHFGASLSMVSYASSGGLVKSMLAIGIPGESITQNTKPDAGRVVATTTVGSAIETVEYEEIHQDSTDVGGATETGDAFGWSVELINRAPASTVPVWSDLLLTVGVPGEESGTLADAGGIQVFSMVGTPGEHDTWVDLAQQPGITWAAKANARLGTYLRATPGHLLIGDPLGDGPAVYGVTWDNILALASDPVVEIRPGLNGVPTDVSTAFGAAAV